MVDVLRDRNRALKMRLTPTDPLPACYPYATRIARD
jgi:hypothetical protein